MSIENHDYLIPIESNAILWRYMNFDKFISMLETESLFFCRADKFSDPFEGTIPRKEVEYRPTSFRQICDIYNVPFETEKFEKWESKIIDFNKRTRISTVINCWHINNYESDAMWRLYLKTNEGVAVQTSPQRLLSSFTDTKESINPSKVRYIDFDNDIYFHEIDYPVTSVNSLTTFIHKRVEFKSENEFRLFHIVEDALFYQSENYWNKKDNRIGMFIGVNVETLIDKVYFPPTLGKNEQKEIELKVKDLGYTLNFQPSMMQKNPNY